jgi:hypothetical protein
MVAKKELSFVEWSDFGQRIGQFERAMQIAIGDWVNYGGERWGGQTTFEGEMAPSRPKQISREFYLHAKKQSGLEVKTLKNYAWIASQFKVSLRRDTFSKSTYEVLAPLPEEEKEKWVDLVYEEPVPVLQIAHSIKLSERLGVTKIFSKDEIIESAIEGKTTYIDAPEIVLDRFIRSMKKQDFSTWTEEMKKCLWKRFIEASDLMEAMGEP